MYLKAGAVPSAFSLPQNPIKVCVFCERYGIIANTDRENAMSDHTEILKRLAAQYPDAKPELKFTSAFQLLIAVMLSAQTTDRQVNAVTGALFARYPDAASLAAADVEETEGIIRSCGFYHTKARNIKAAAAVVADVHGGQVPRTMEELTALPGVGRKTANVVLSNAFGIPAIAVDTHVQRVSNRLGLANSKDVLETEKQLMEAIPKAQWSEAHHWLIYHGRRVCAAQRPKCDMCFLRDLCPHGRKTEDVCR
jgi:endonuclease III